MKLSEYQRSRSFFDLGQRSLRFQSQMFDFWPVYSGERFRAFWPSCFLSYGPLKIFLLLKLYLKKYLSWELETLPADWKLQADEMMNL